MYPTDNDAHEDGRALFQSQRKRWSAPRVIVSELRSGTELLLKDPFTAEHVVPSGTTIGTAS